MIHLAKWPLSMLLTGDKALKSEDVTMSRKDDFDWGEFFHGEYGIARSLYKGRIPNSKVVKGCERIATWSMDIFGYGINETAYFMATSYHETAYRMHPVRETLALTDGQAKRRLENAWKKGQLAWVKTPYWREGWFGRGEVQLTHRANYAGPLRDAVMAEFGAKYDILKKPGLLISKPDISTFVLIEGMTRSNTGVSDFTSHALEDFIFGDTYDYHGARRTVNPGDKPSYEKIAAEAMAFRRALVGAQ